MNGCIDLSKQKKRITITDGSCYAAADSFLSYPDNLIVWRSGVTRHDYSESLRP